MALLDERFSAHTGRGGGWAIKIQELVAHFVVMYEDEASFDASKYMTYIVGRRAAIVFVLEVRKGNIIWCAKKTTKFHR